MNSYFLLLREDNSGSARGGTRTHKVLLPADFKSAVYTNSTTRAGLTHNLRLTIYNNII